MIRLIFFSQLLVSDEFEKTNNTAICGLYYITYLLFFFVFFFHHKHTTLIHPMEDIGAMSEIFYARVTPLNSESLCNLAVQYHTAPWLKIYTQYAFMAFLQPAISDAW